VTRLLAPLAAAALLAPSPAAAFWEYGHETVARIAYANVRPATKAAIRRLLAQDRLLETPECRANTIESASTWADCVKPLKNPDGTSRFGYAYSWHYQNVNVCAAFDLGPPCRDGNCVSAQITRQRVILADRGAKPADRVRALAFLIHFVGDLHQPLHAGDRADKGGNDVPASWGGFGGDRFNLHSVWDGPLAERAISTPPALVRRYPAAVRARLAAGTVADWSRQSWQVSRDAAYATAMGGDPCAPAAGRVSLDEAQVAKLVPVMRDEVERGGLRLARLLDEALGQGKGRRPRTARPA